MIRCPIPLTLFLRRRSSFMVHQALRHAPRAARITASRRYVAYVIQVLHAVPDAGSAAPLQPAPRLRPTHAPDALRGDLS
ncbi:hypothetical protein OG601_45790 [Streptomyces sp. NBC_01239]|uniref:hypothetical protein n=1 Tax=Streptomyces sp. NBC_01239 TaxID=2903792 RepID=UPI00225427AC|nr:hypothetical protein [Streptomyces sp. NBC_01239]MCX4817908.1 hypothetical protein [Streptomyces sp. NBC_01239]